MELSQETKKRLTEALEGHGMRLTRQREQVYSLIHDNKSHPTAEELYALARSELPSISLATIYNCLETFVSCNLVRPVHLGRHSTRYEPALEEHAHFICQDCGKVFDIKISDEFLESLKGILPPGFTAENVQLDFTGHAACENVDHCEEIADKANLTTQPLA